MYIFHFGSFRNLNGPKSMRIITVKPWNLWHLPRYWFSLEIPIIASFETIQMRWTKKKTRWKLKRHALVVKFHLKQTTHINTNQFKTQNLSLNFERTQFKRAIKIYLRFFSSSSFKSKLSHETPDINVIKFCDFCFLAPFFVLSMPTIFLSFTFQVRSHLNVNIFHKFSTFAYIRRNITILWKNMHTQERQQQHDDDVWRRFVFCLASNNFFFYNFKYFY